MGSTNPKLDVFFRKLPQWREEFAALRDIIQDLWSVRDGEVALALLHP